MICKPVMTMGALVAALGYILIVDGIIHVISYFSIDNIDRVFNYELAQATIDIIMGFVLICNTSSFTLILPICIGIWIIVDGILKAQTALLWILEELRTGE